MLNLILILVVVWIVLTVVLAAWTLWFQGYIYSEPTPGILWRAPAAGTVLVLVLLVWVFFDYRAPGRYRTLIEFNPSEDQEYQQLRVVTKNHPVETYQLRKNARGMPEYHNVRAGGPALPGRPDEVVVEDDGKKYTFKPDRSTEGSTLRYLDERGKVMLEGQLGRVRTYHTGWLLGNLFLNFLQLVAWWICLWVLLRFQMSHALGLAVVFWLVMILAVMPLVLDRTEQAAPPRVPLPTPPRTQLAAPDTLFAWAASEARDRSESAR